MPLKLVKPREGKTPYWAVRGHYLGNYVDRSTKVCKKSLAKKILQKWEREIERGEFASKDELTFAGAAMAYMKAGGDPTRLPPILEHFKDSAVKDLDQPAIDSAAVVLFPTQTAATRNREFYTPVSAVLKHVGVKFEIKRPKGWRGTKRTDWLWPEEAFAVFKAARAVDAEFAAFLVTLCYTGPRLSELLAVRTDDVRLQEAFAYIGTTKNGDPRAMFLPPVVVTELANHPRGMDRRGQKLFRFSKNGRLYELLRLTEKACGLKLTFHLFCHTWATWMRRYGGLDTRGLVATGRWRDEASASRYEHVVVSEESRKALLLPVDSMRKRQKAR